MPVRLSLRKWERHFAVYDADLIRRLCAEIREEKDPDRAQDLISVVQAVLKDDQEEIRVRLAFLSSKYAAEISDAKAAD